jgi:hypothetical protein
MSANSAPGFKTYPDHRIATQPAGVHVQIRYNGEIVADTTDAIRLEETHVGHVVAPVVLGPANANFAPALPRESDGCKARCAGKGLPLPSDATQQTRFLAATRRDGPIRAHPFVASRFQ